MYVGTLWLKTEWKVDKKGFLKQHEGVSMQPESVQHWLKAKGISVCISGIENLPLIVSFALTERNFKL